MPIPCLTSVHEPLLLSAKSSLESELRRFVNPLCQHGLITGFAIRFPEKRLIDVTDACNYANRTGVIGAFTFLKEYAAGPAKIGHFVMAGPSIRLSNTVSLGGAANNTELVDVIFGEMSKAATQICEDWIDVFVALSKSKKTLDSILAAAGKYTPGVTVLKI